MKEEKPSAQDELDKEIQDLLKQYDQRPSNSFVEMKAKRDPFTGASAIIEEEDKDEE